MERPLAVIGFAYLSALVVALFVGAEQCWLLAALLTVGFVLSLFWKKLRKDKVIPTVLLTMAIASAVFGIWSATQIQPIQILKGEMVSVQGQLCDLPYEQNGRYYYTLNTKKIDFDHAPQNVKILVSSKVKLKVKPYDTISAEVKFYGDNNSRYGQYQIARGIFLQGKMTSEHLPTVIPNDNPPVYHYILDIRKAVIDKVEERLSDEQAPLIQALLIGDKTTLSSDDKDNLTIAGITHIAVVSGLHLSVLTQFVMLFVTFLLRGQKRKAALVTVVVLLLYMAVVGFSPSVVRAGLMNIIFLVGIAIMRQADSLNSLAIATLVLCLLNPYAVGDVGFLLSVTATLGIVICSPKLKIWLNERLLPLREELKPKKRTAILTALAKAILSVVTVTVSATVFTLPIVIVNFKQIALYSVLSNLLVSLAVTVAILSSMIMVLLSMTGILSWAAIPFAWLSGAMSDYIRYIAKSVAQLPYSTLNLSADFVPLWLGLMLILGAVLLLLKNKQRAVRYYVLTAILTLIVGSVSGMIVSRGSVKLSVLDTGNGLSVVMMSDKATAVLYCGGDYANGNTVVEYLENSGVSRIDYCLLSGTNAVTSAYAPSVIQQFDLGTVQIDDEQKQYADLLTITNKAERQILIDSSVQPSNTVYIDGAKIQTVKQKKANAVLVETHHKRILICADKTDCTKLPKEWTKVDFWILNGTIENADCIVAEEMIISDSTEHLPQYGTIYKQAKHHYATGGNGAVALRIFKNNEMTLRREKDWLS